MGPHAILIFHYPMDQLIFNISPTSMLSKCEKMLYHEWEYFHSHTHSQYTHKQIQTHTQTHTHLAIQTIWFVTVEYSKEP